MNGIRSPLAVHPSYLVTTLSNISETIIDTIFFPIIFLHTDFLWLHIRGVGGWTNKLHDYFVQQQAKLCPQQGGLSIENKLLSRQTSQHSSQSLNAMINTKYFTLPNPRKLHSECVASVNRAHQVPFSRSVSFQPVVFSRSHSIISEEADSTVEDVFTEDEQNVNHLRVPYRYAHLVSTKWTIEKHLGSNGIAIYSVDRYRWLLAK